MRVGAPLTLVVMLTLAGAMPAALAGVFDQDARDENRKTQIELAEFRDKTNAQLDRFDAALRMQVELSNQIEALRAELAALRGQLEVASHDIDSSQKRQRDFYLDLDNRLRKLEETTGDLSAKAAVLAEAPPPVKPRNDAAAETRLFEEGLNLFKGKNYKGAQDVFEHFLKEYPESALTASTRFWLGNTFYARRDCKKAIESHRRLLAEHADSSKAPDAMLAIATCQKELADKKGYRKTLEQVVAKHPGTPAAKTARQRLREK